MTTAQTEGVLLRVRYRIAGGHVHCRLFTRSSPMGQFAKCGDLTFARAEWDRWIHDWILHVGDVRAEDLTELRIHLAADTDAKHEALRRVQALADTHFHRCKSCPSVLTCVSAPCGTPPSGVWSCPTCELRERDADLHRSADAARSI